MITPIITHGSSVAGAVASMAQAVPEPLPEGIGYLHPAGIPLRFLSDSPAMRKYEPGFPAGVVETQGRRILEMLLSEHLKTVIDHCVAGGLRAVYVAPDPEGGRFTRILYDDGNGRQKITEPFGVAKQSAVLVFHPEFIQASSAATIGVCVEHELWHVYEFLYHPVRRTALHTCHRNALTFGEDWIVNLLRSLEHFFLRLDAHRMGRSDFVDADIGLFRRLVDSMAIEPFPLPAGIAIYMGFSVETVGVYNALGRKSDAEREVPWIRDFLKRVIPGLPASYYMRIMEIGDSHWRALMRLIIDADGTVGPEDVFPEAALMKLAGLGCDFVEDKRLSMPGVDPDLLSGWTRR